MAAPKVPALQRSKTSKLPSFKNPATPQIKNVGLQGYLQASKMKPLIASIKSQLNQKY